MIKRNVHIYEMGVSQGFVMVLHSHVKQTTIRSGTLV